MRLCKKLFLFTAGALTIAFDEVAKAIDEATESVEFERNKIKVRITRNKPNKSSVNAK